MKHNWLLVVFIAALVIAAIISGFLHTIDLFEKPDVSDKRAIIVLGFIFMVEFLRGIFVVSNTYVRQINFSWGIVMLFASIGITAGLAMFGHSNSSDELYWAVQVYNVLILFCEWSISVVMAGIRFDWDGFVQDLFNFEAGERDYTELKTAYIGNIQWHKVPKILKPLHKVLDDVHDKLQTRDTDCDSIREIMDNTWTSIGNSKQEYAVFCSGNEHKMCGYFIAPRSQKRIQCPKCGKMHDRDKHKKFLKGLTDD